jgi:hypothetical protein
VEEDGGHFEEFEPDPILRLAAAGVAKFGPERVCRRVMPSTSVWPKTATDDN